MNKSLLIKKFAEPLRLYDLARVLTRRSPRILMYHRFSENPRPGYVSAQAFEHQLVYLQKKYHLVSMTELVRGLRGDTPLNPNTIALTVDDGYADFYEVAFPILKRMGLPATIFVTTRFADGNFWLWPDIISYVLSNASSLIEDVQAGDLAVRAGLLSLCDRSDLWLPIVSYLLTLPDAEKHRWIQRFARSAQVDIPQSPPMEYGAASWTQLHEMQRHGIEIGGHTATHPSLGRVTLAQLKAEVAECKNALDRNLGERERQFCYPNGQPQDLNEDVKAAVREGGFASSVVAFYDRNALNDLYELRRYSASEDNFQFLKAINGIELLASRLLDSHNRLTWQF